VIILPPAVNVYIEKMPEWATSKDAAAWAYLCRRFAEDRREWKQKARLLGEVNAKLCADVEELQMKIELLQALLDEQSM
jgi:hypothetical protein